MEGPEGEALVPASSAIDPLLRLKTENSSKGRNSPLGSGTPPRAIPGSVADGTSRTTADAGTAGGAPSPASVRTPRSGTAYETIEEEPEAPLQLRVMTDVLDPGAANGGEGPAVASGGAGGAHASPAATAPRSVAGRAAAPYDATGRGSGGSYRSTTSFDASSRQSSLSSSGLSTGLRVTLPASEPSGAGARPGFGPTASPRAVPLPVMRTSAANAGLAAYDPPAYRVGEPQHAVKRALLVLNVQNDFFEGGAFPLAGAEPTLQVINDLRMKDWSAVVMSSIQHAPNHSSFCGCNPGTLLHEVVPTKQSASLGPQVMWPRHCVAGTFGAQFHPELRVEATDHVFQIAQAPSVEVFSAFEPSRSEEDALQTLLKTLEIEQVWVCGFVTDYAVQFTALDAKMLLDDVSVFVVEDACAGLTSDGVAEAYSKFAVERISVVRSDSVDVMAIPLAPPREDPSLDVLLGRKQSVQQFDHDVDDLAREIGLLESKGREEDDGDSGSEINEADLLGTASRTTKSDNLVIAVARGDSDVVSKMMSELPWIVTERMQPHNLDALMMAARVGNVEALDDLLTFGVDPNVVGHEGVTPLMLALQGGHFGCVTRLLKESRIDVAKTDRLGNTPLIVAAQLADVQSVTTLLAAAEASPKIMLSSYVNHANEFGHTALMMACSVATDSVSRAWDMAARTALPESSVAAQSTSSKKVFFATKAAEKRGAPGKFMDAGEVYMRAATVVDLLFGSTPHPSRRLTMLRSADSEGWTALHFAAASGMLSRIDWSALQGEIRRVPVNIATLSGLSMLQLATWNGHASAVAVLLGSWPSRPNPWRARVRVNNNVRQRGHTELDLAVQRDHLDSSRLIIRSGGVANKLRGTPCDLLFGRLVLRGDGITAELLLRHRENGVRVDKAVVQLVRTMKYPDTCTFTFAAYHNPTRQFMFQCHTCKQKICLLCADRCHRQNLWAHVLHRRHRVEYLGLVEGYCSCAKETCRSLSVVDEREAAGYKYQPCPLDTSDVEIDFEGEEKHLGDLCDMMARNSHEVWAKAKLEGGWTYGPKRDDKRKWHPQLVPYAYVPEENKTNDIDTARQMIKVITAVGFDIIHKSGSPTRRAGSRSAITPTAMMESERRRLDKKESPQHLSRHSTAESATSLSTDGFESWVPRPIDTSAIHLPQQVSDLVEVIAQDMHEQWALGKISRGWHYAPFRLQGEEADESSTRRKPVKPTHVTEAHTKVSPMLVPYKFLTDSEKDLNRKSAAEMVRLMLYFGYEFVVQPGKTVVHAGELGRRITDFERERLEKRETQMLAFKQGLYNSFLSSAAAWNDTDMIELLLNAPRYRSHSAYVNAVDEQGRSALYLAVQHGHSDAAEVLLSYGANMELCDVNGVVPLSIAAYNGDDALLELLLSHGASYTTTDKIQFTPIHYAAYAGHVEVCRALARKLNGKGKPGVDFRFEEDKKLSNVVDVLLRRRRENSGVFTIRAGRFRRKSSVKAHRNVPVDLPSAKAAQDNVHDTLLRLTAVASEFTGTALTPFGDSRPRSIADNLAESASPAGRDEGPDGRRSAFRDDHQGSERSLLGDSPRNGAGRYDLWHIGGSGMSKSAVDVFGKTTSPSEAISAPSSVTRKPSLTNRRPKALLLDSSSHDTESDDVSRWSKATDEKQDSDAMDDTGAFQPPPKPGTLFALVKEPSRAQETEEEISFRARVGAALRRPLKAKLSPLTIAVHAREMDVVTELVSLGGDPNLKDDSGVSPYDRALYEHIAAKIRVEGMLLARTAASSDGLGGFLKVASQFPAAAPTAPKTPRKIFGNDAPGPDSPAATTGDISNEDVDPNASNGARRWQVVRSRLRVSGDAIAAAARGVEQRKEQRFARTSATSILQRDRALALAERRSEIAIDKALAAEQSAAEMVQVLNTCTDVKRRRTLFALQTLAKKALIFLMVVLVVVVMTPVAPDYRSQEFASFRTSLLSTFERSFTEQVTSPATWFKWVDHNLLWGSGDEATMAPCSDASIAAIAGDVFDPPLFLPANISTGCRTQLSVLQGGHVLLGAILVEVTKAAEVACNLNFVENGPTTCRGLGSDDVRVSHLMSSADVVKRRAVVNAAARSPTDGWLTSSTSYVTIDFALYNPSIEVFANVQFQAAFERSGVIESSVDVRAVSPFNGRFPPSVVFEVIFGAMVLSQAFALALEARKLGMGRFLRSGWNWADLISVLVAIVVIIVDFIALSAAHDIVANATEFEQRVDVTTVHDTLIVETDLIAVLILLFVVRIIKYLRILPGWGPMVVAVLMTWQDASVLTYLAVSLGLTFSLSVAFHAAFGAEVLEFSSIPNSFYVLFTMSFAEDWHEVEGASERGTTTVFYITYVVFAVVLLNLFIGIVTDVYPKARERSQKQWDEFITSMMQEDVLQKLNVDAVQTPINRAMWKWFECTRRLRRRFCRNRRAVSPSPALPTITPKVNGAKAGDAAKVCCVTLHEPVSMQDLKLGSDTFSGLHRIVRAITTTSVPDVSGADIAASAKPSARLSAVGEDIVLPGAKSLNLPAELAGKMSQDEASARQLDILANPSTPVAVGQKQPHKLRRAGSGETVIEKPPSSGSGTPSGRRAAAAVAAENTRAIRALENAYRTQQGDFNKQVSTLAQQLKDLRSFLEKSLLERPGATSPPNL